MTIIHRSQTAATSRPKIRRDNFSNFDIVRVSFMNLKIRPGSASNLECFQKSPPLMLCLIALLTIGTTSCIKQPSTGSDNSKSSPAPSYVVQDLLQYAKPLCGTAA